MMISRNSFILALVVVISFVGGRQLVRNRSSEATKDKLRVSGSGSDINTAAAAAAASSLKDGSGPPPSLYDKATMKKVGSTYECLCPGTTTIDGTYLDSKDLDYKNVAQKKGNDESSTSIVITPSLGSRETWKVQSKNLSLNCGSIIDFNVPGKRDPPGVLLWGQFYCDRKSYKYERPIVLFYKVDEHENPIGNAVGEWERFL
mmetsp:Transcript_44010/g.47675  ORF Transcript_44010/g.47675 Transcript_44010/m.47675 type:complete len:203 (+) Transcript_44010:83-691(+)